MKLSARGQKVLKALHILTAVCWVGGALSLFALNHFTGDFAFGEQAYGLNFAKHAIDVAIVIIPGAIGCFLTGLCYSLFTSWGFCKHGFVLAKWALSIFLMLTGTFYLGPRERLLLELSKTQSAAELCAETGQYFITFHEYVNFGFVQSGLLVFLIILSGWKPKKRKG